MSSVALAAASCATGVEQAASATPQAAATSTLISSPALPTVAQATSASGAATAVPPTRDATQQPSATVGATATTVIVAQATGTQAVPTNAPPANKDLFVVGAGSKATFTVNEKLAILPAPNDAVLTTSALTGSVDLAGGEFTVTIDLHQLRSDQSRRDGYVRQQMFPRQRTATARFKVDGDLPASFLAGEDYSTTATGTVNVNGQDSEVEFEVTARLTGDTLLVLGRADFVWADFGMRAPVSSNFVVKDEVHVEVLLQAERG